MIQALAMQNSTGTGTNGTTTTTQAQRIAMARDYLYGLAANGASVAAIAQWTGAMENNQITPGMSEQLVQTWWGRPTEQQMFSTAQGLVEVWMYRPLGGSAFNVTFLNHSVAAVQ